MFSPISPPQKPIFARISALYLKKIFKIAVLKPIFLPKKYFSTHFFLSGTSSKLLAPNTPTNFKVECPPPPPEGSRITVRQADKRVGVDKNM